VRTLFFISIITWHFIDHAQAQYAPQVGFVGCTAIYKDSSIIVAWADSCSISRGWQNIQDTSLGFASAGTQIEAIAKADGQTCSLGDKGYAVYYFGNPICNKPGADFAIFENAFRSLSNDSLAFLELATVAVSSDGTEYLYFPAVSNTSTAQQVGGFAAQVNARHIYNLAGKYIADYGTPFDLSDLPPSILVDLQNIRFIKITDVCGSIVPSDATLDQNQNYINDPFPTPFASGGFDLDALAIIHQVNPSDVGEPIRFHDFEIYPNPSSGMVYINSHSHAVEIFNVMGTQVLPTSTLVSTGISVIDLSTLPKGCYYFRSGEHVKYIMLK
jgi:hypothetical protein